MPVVGTFELEVGHFAFDNSGIGMVLAFGQLKVSDVTQQAVPEPWMVKRVNQLKLDKSITDQSGSR
jgi:hypothetical protein